MALWPTGIMLDGTALPPTHYTVCKFPADAGCLGVLDSYFIPWALVARLFGQKHFSCQVSSKTSADFKH